MCRGGLGRGSRRRAKIGAAPGRGGTRVSAIRLELIPGGVARLTLARPERKNAFDGALIAELVMALAEIDPSTRTVVLASEGDTFCAGADLDWMRSTVDYTREENVADSLTLAGMFR